MNDILITDILSHQFFFEKNKIFKIDINVLKKYCFLKTTPKDKEIIDILLKDNLLFFNSSKKEILIKNLPSFTLTICKMFYVKVKKKNINFHKKKRFCKQKNTTIEYAYFRIIKILQKK